MLEANAIPGLTETSLLPQAAEAAGIAFDELIARVLDLAVGAAAERQPARSALKSSGVTWSRNSLNLSTTSSVSSTSCSNSIADSAITSSAAKIGAPERTASASASLGRESISTSRPLTDERDRRVERVLAQLGDRDAGAGHVELAEHVEQQVVRHRPRRRRALELHQDRRRLGMADPDRQELVRVDGLEQHDRLLADHVEAHAVDDHLLHRGSSAAGVSAKYRLTRGRPRPLHGPAFAPAGERRSVRANARTERLRGTAEPHCALGEEGLELAGRGGQPPGEVLLETLEATPRDHRLVSGVALGGARVGLGFEHRPLDGGSTFRTCAVSVHRWRQGSPLRAV